jgi:hypothetical protein
MRTYEAGMDALIEPLARAVLDASDAVTRADKYHAAARTAGCPCARQHRREFAEAVHAHKMALRRVRRAIADARGWAVGHKPFDVSKLTGPRCPSTDGVVEHVDCFRVGVRPYRRPAAIVTHSYRPAAVIEAWAAEHGLACELLPLSWYSRSTTAALLYPRADR